MSDEVLRSYMKPVKVEEIATRTGRGPSDFFPRLVRLFIADGQEAELIDYKAMGRKWSAVVQGLRVALKNTKNEDGTPLSDLAWVSAKKDTQTIYLRRRLFPLSPGETKPGRGRPKKNS